VRAQDGALRYDHHMCVSTPPLSLSQLCGLSGLPRDKLVDLCARMDQLHPQVRQAGGGGGLMLSRFKPPV
jgi:hypothetical protein